MDAIDSLHRLILGCTLCQDEGFIDRAAPVVAAWHGARMMLIGQAPGVTELEVRRPFAGRAGRVLFGWMASIGISEAEFRHTVYMTSITKCFPGKASTGSGDRRPSSREIALCRPYLEAQVRYIEPEVILLVGGLAIERYFPKLPLGRLIGTAIDRDDRVYIPLPHPSGASRWLNHADNRALLREGLVHVQAAWDRLAPLREPASTVS
jgi:uracil-DNA glycosylase